MSDAVQPSLWDSQVQIFQHCLDAVQRVRSLGDLATLLEAALQPPPLPGSSEAVQGLAHACSSASERCGHAAEQLRAVSDTSLPEAWHGMAANSAGAGLRRLVTETTSGKTGLMTVAGHLQYWAESMNSAQRQDHDGISAIREAQIAVLTDLSLTTVFGPFLGKLFDPQVTALRAKLLEGCTARLRAVHLYSTAASDTARNLEACLRIAQQSQLEPVEPHIVSSYVGDLLTPTVYTRAVQRLDQLEPSDRATFWQLLSNAKSSMEAAYLWKAFAANYSMADVIKFDQQIDPHGTDPDWLKDHLTPDIFPTDPKTAKTDYEALYKGLTTNGTPFDMIAHITVYGTEGPHCAPASIVVATMASDPVLMLALTTGTGPAARAVEGAPYGDDSSDAFRLRLHDAYSRYYAEGRWADWWDHPIAEIHIPEGVSTDSAAMLANELLKPATGSTYHLETLDTEAARSQAIAGIRSAVESGKPVPLTLSNDSKQHQAVIIGEKDGKLIIYDPSGVTVSVPADQLVHNQLGAVTAEYQHPLPKPAAELFPD